MKFRLSLYILFFFIFFCRSQIYSITQNLSFDKKILENVKEMRVYENEKLFDLQNFDRKGNPIFDKMNFNSLTVIYGYQYEENSRISRVIMCSSIYDIMIFDYVYKDEFCYTYEYSCYKSNSSDLNSFEKDYYKIDNLQELLSFQVVQDIMKTKKVLIRKSKINKEGKILESYKIQNGVENFDFKIEYLEGKEIMRFPDSNYYNEKHFDKERRIVKDGDKKFFYDGKNLVKTISKNCDDEILITDYIVQDNLLIKELDYINGKLKRYTSYRYDYNKLVEKIVQSGDQKSKEIFEFIYW